MLLKISPENALGLESQIGFLLQFLMQFLSKALKVMGNIEEELIPLAPARSGFGSEKNDIKNCT